MTGNVIPDWIPQWWVWEKVFLVNISDGLWSQLRDIIRLCLMTLGLRTSLKSTNASYLKQLVQFLVTSKGLAPRCEVSSASTCCTSNPYKFAGRYPMLSASTCAKIPCSQHQAILLFSSSLFFSARRRDKPRRRDELSADQFLLDLCIAN